jgi:hypothetical protein
MMSGNIATTTYQCLECQRLYIAEAADVGMNITLICGWFSSVGKQIFKTIIFSWWPEVTFQIFIWLLLLQI